MEKEVATFSLRINIPRTDPSFTAIINKWCIKSKKSAGKTKENLGKVIATEEDYEQKIAQSSLDSYLKVMTITKPGFNGAKFIRNYRNNLLKSAPKWREGVAKTYKPRSKVEAFEYKQKVDDNADNYLFGTGSPLSLTNATYPKKSVIALALMALSPTAKIQKRFLKAGDAMTGSAVSIVSPAKRGEFRKALNNLIMKYGSKILIFFGFYEKELANCRKNELGQSTEPPAPDSPPNQNISQSYQFMTQFIKEGNQELNALADSYRTKDIASFIPGGASHIDFTIDRRADSIAGETDKPKIELYLDIQVAKSVD